MYEYLDRTKVGVIARRDIMAMKYYPKIVAGTMTWEEAYALVDEVLARMA